MSTKKPRFPHFSLVYVGIFAIFACFYLELPVLTGISNQKNFKTSSNSKWEELQSKQCSSSRKEGAKIAQDEILGKRSSEKFPPRSDCLFCQEKI